MTQEEKARRYDEALERAKRLYEQGTITESLSNVFPELKESEDERVRKEIIDFIWKEKIFLQEVHLSVENSPKYRFVMDAIAWLEKQGEQKPKWTEEDERGSDETIELLEYFINYAPEFRKPAIGRSVAWLKSLKQRMGV